jgi:SAM-dependent methyltransferase
MADVPYVPTPWVVVEAMLNVAKVTKDDYVVDLGCGDGRLVILAAKKHGASGFGVDIDGKLVSEAQREARRQGVEGKALFYERNLFITDFSKATVMTMYLTTKINLQLRPRLFETLKPGARIVSHDFDMGNWREDERLKIAVPDKPYGPPSSEIYLWILPANAAGVWQWRTEAGGAFEVALEQTFQMLAGKAQGAAASAEGRMRGDAIRLALNAQAGGRTVRHDLEGRIEGDRIAGRFRTADGAEGAWNATRVKRGSIALPEER